MDDADEVTLLEPVAEPLPLAEIKRLYPDRFVVLSDSIWRDCKLGGGIPRAYSKSCRALSPIVKTFHSGIFSVYFTGQRRNPRDWVVADVDGKL